MHVLLRNGVDVNVPDAHRTVALSGTHGYSAVQAEQRVALHFWSARCKFTHFSVLVLGVIADFAVMNP